MLRASVLCSAVLAGCWSRAGFFPRQAVPAEAPAAIASLRADTVAPSEGPTSGGTELVLSGEALFDGAAVTLACTDGGCDAPCVMPIAAADGTRLTCTTSPSRAGSHDVRVTLESGESTTIAGAFFYRDPPRIDGVSPSEGPLTGGTPVVLAGDTIGLGTPLVDFGGAACTNVVVVNAGQISCVTPAQTTAGPVDVTVSTVGGLSRLANGFVYLAAPTLISVSPTEGPPAGGTTLTLTGAAFHASMTATVSGIPCTSLTILSATSAECVTPPATLTGVSRAVAVSATIAGQTHTLMDAFTYLQPGVLDHTFATGGVARLAGQSFASIRDMLVLPDDRLLVAGVASPTTAVIDRRVFLARLLPDGALDPSFGGGTGTVLADLAVGVADEAFAVGRLSNGRIVVAGAREGADRDMLVALFDSDGTLLGQNTFGGAGDQAAFDLVVQPDDKVVLAGYSGPWSRALDAASCPNGVDVFGHLARVDGTPALTLDTAGFRAPNGRGSYTMSFDAGWRCTIFSGVVLSGSGGIVATGSAYSSASTGPKRWQQGALKVIADGMVDASFNGGFTRWSFPIGPPDNTTANYAYGAIARGADAGFTVTLAGGVDTTMGQLSAFLRAGPAGSIDLGFQGGGANPHEGTGFLGEQLNAVAIDANDKVVLAGYATADDTTRKEVMTIIRVDATSFDQGFNPRGRVIDTGTLAQRCRAVGLQSTAKIICAGWGGTCAGATNVSECADAVPIVIRVWP